MSDRDTDLDDLPTSGLADDLIPLLRQRLGERARERGDDPAAVMSFVDALDSETAPEAAPAPDAPVRRLVTFWLDREEYGVPITEVQEILRLGAVTRVPGAPPVVRGVMNVRGRLLAVVDARRCLGYPEAEPTSRSRVVMMELEHRRVGLLVDRVSYVVTVPASEIEPNPHGGDRADYVGGLAKHRGRLIVLLDLARLLVSCRMESM